MKFYGGVKRLKHLPISTDLVGYSLQASRGSGDLQGYCNVYLAIYPANKGVIYRV